MKKCFCGKSANYEIRAILAPNTKTFLCETHKPIIEEFIESWGNMGMFITIRSLSDLD